MILGPYGRLYRMVGVSDSPINGFESSFCGASLPLDRFNATLSILTAPLKSCKSYTRNLVSAAIVV